MKKIKLPARKEWNQLLSRPRKNFDDIEDTVKEVFGEVKNKGDVALKRYTELFDGVKLDDIMVSESEIAAAVNDVDESLKAAIQLAKSNIEEFHKAQATESLKVEPMEGVVCWRDKRAIEKVGLYIPGGTAPLFSSILMLAVPAKIAGCREIVMCTPPGSDGNINPVVLYTAYLCGVKKIYKLGGIQAIAGITFGTETVEPVYKIFGPGNQFVTVAKQISTKHGVAIDMPAGPSELLIYADDSANPAFVASDLLSQAEHGVDSQVILISTSEGLLDKVQTELKVKIEKLPRKDIAAAALVNSKMILSKNEEEALDIINEYGPEHFIVISEKEDVFIDNIRNAGSVFIGNYTPESAGDYASGTNHTLPTNGYAKQYSGVNLDSFLKSITFQKISRDGLNNIGPAIELMAAAEGLDAHKNAVSIRLED